MSKLKFNLVSDDDGNANITVYHGGKTYPANNTHPAWDGILAKALAGDTSVIDLFDVAHLVGKRMELSGRVSYAGGHLFVDGDELEDGLADHILRMLGAGEDVEPFVALLENILQNPDAHSRKQLYSYVNRNRITITRDGRLVLYKYLYHAVTVTTTNPDGSKPFRSGHAGPAIVNGVPHKHGYVLQGIGDVVTMPRSEVINNPGNPCAHGLHVGAWAYVSGSGDVTAEVHVHPRDVVSVPRDAHERKIRVCRYEIIRTVTEDYSVPVLPPETLVTPVPVAEPQEPAQSPSGPAEVPASIAPKFSEPVRSSGRSSGRRAPTQKEFDQMRARAKKRRQNFVKYASKVGKWVLTGNGDKPKDWRLS